MSRRRRLAERRELETIPVTRLGDFHGINGFCLAHNRERSLLNVAPSDRQAIVALLGT